MIAPPGRPKMVVTPSSTSDWHMALAPFKRIDVLISVERTIALPRSPEKSRRTKKPHPLQGRGLLKLAVPPCFVLSAQYRPPPRRGLVALTLPLPEGEVQISVRSPARLRGEFGNL